MAGDSTLPGPGQISQDYTGSYDEWFERVVADLCRRYSMGMGGLGSDDPELGRPSQEDYASGQNGGVPKISGATRNYWERFVRKYGATDPFVQGNYGKPPERRATYVTDPNSNAGLMDREAEEAGKDRAEDARQFDETIKQQQADREARAAEAAAERASREAMTKMQEEGESARQSERIAADAAENAKAREFQSKESAVDRAFRETQAELDRSLAREREANETNRIGMQITSNEKIALMEDATRRYEAEGSWGVQKYIAELQESGALARLELELGDREADRAQRATEERNRNHEAMVGLVLKVAEVDAEMASQPRNWLKYAAWLENRGQVVNGLSLAMAAQEVPETSIDPSELANSSLSGTSVATVQTMQQMASSSTSPTAGGSDAQATAQQMAGSQNANTQANPYQVGDIDLSSTNYADTLTKLLGPNAGVNGVDNSEANLSAILSGLDTRGHMEGATPATGTGPQVQGGPTSASQSIASALAKFDARGASHDYRKFAKLLPSGQEMQAGAVEAKGISYDDFLSEMQRSRPKGGAVGAGGYG